MLLCRKLWFCHLFCLGVVLFSSFIVTDCFGITQTPSRLKLANIHDPIDDYDGVNKQYVDGINATLSEDIATLKSTLEDIQSQLGTLSAQVSGLAVQFDGLPKPGLNQFRIASVSRSGEQGYHYTDFDGVRHDLLVTSECFSRVGCCSSDKAICYGIRFSEGYAYIGLDMRHVEMMQMGCTLLSREDDDPKHNDHLVMATDGNTTVFGMEVGALIYITNLVDSNLSTATSTPMVLSKNAGYRIACFA